MDKIDTKNVAIFLLVILAICVIYPMLFGKKEGFDADMLEFVPVGSDRYGLRGNLIKWVPISDYFINANPNIRINRSGGDMWVSNNPPEGKTCGKIECPSFGYDKLDQCWQC